ncbi:diacylglycerol kinase family protein [Oleisolibacter albus]|uniref:diacylglycerol kinase family protein n=1 Tax=Oleisolibacter albus TaxID=2171757 RepID=UPI000DF312B5|nr:diacylglycerol kinase family protein [Oleisolibacter albus]
MIRVGLIRNPRSQRNKRGGGDMRTQAAALLGYYFAEPATPAELAEVLADFARHEVGIICIDGGDGTVREVLTALPAAYGGELPKLAILASGKTNLIAADVGSPGHGLEGFGRLVDDARKGFLGSHLQRRPLLEISWPDGSHETIRGMFMGAGAFTRATDLANSSIHARGLYNNAAVVLTMANVLGSALLGRDRDGWLDGEPMTVSDGRDNGRDGNRFIFLATTLHRLVMGLWPFWGEGNGALRYLDVAAHPTRLTAALAPVLRGKPTPWMLADGYRSGVAERLTLGLSAPFIMDGERFEPGPGGTIHLDAGPVVDFVIP